MSKFGYHTKTNLLLGDGRVRVGFLPCYLHSEEIPESEQHPSEASRRIYVTYNIRCVGRFGPWPRKERQRNEPSWTPPQQKNDRTWADTTRRA